MRWWHWALIAVGVLALGGGGATVAVKTGKRGRRIGGKEADTDPATRLCPTAPALLAAAAGASLAEYALARCIASEAGTLPAAGRAGVAWAVRNYAKRVGKGVAELLLGPEKLFGSQNAGKGRYAATSQAPYTADLELARGVLGGAVPDPTRGAIQWDSPAAQRALLARKAAGYRKTPEDVAATRRKEGKEVVYLAGVDAEKLRFWRPA
jgi:hypothetical protein